MEEADRRSRIEIRRRTTKKLKVGEKTIGALFSPAALPEEGEEELKDNDLEIDEDEENKSFY